MVLVDIYSLTNEAYCHIAWHGWLQVEIHTKGDNLPARLVVIGAKDDISSPLPSAGRFFKMRQMSLVVPKDCSKGLTLFS